MFKIFFLIIFVTHFGNALAAPFVPRSENQVLERLPEQLDKVNTKPVRTALQREPANLRFALPLARHYIERARATSDPRHLGYAQAALNPWWNMARPPADVLILRATILQSTHKFEPALADLNRVLAYDPRNAQAWLTRATILQVQGKYPEAAESCKQLEGLSDPLIALTCLASAKSLNGDAQHHYQQLYSALKNPKNVDSSQQIWMENILAEIAERLGDVKNSEKHFKRAFAIDSADVYLKTSYADFLIDRQRYAEVVKLLREDVNADGSLLRLAIAEQSLGLKEAPLHVSMLLERYRAARLRGDALHRREEARFTLLLLNKPAEALRLAKENWRVQREPADARIYLASALASGNVAETQEIVRWLQQTKLEDVRLTRLTQMWPNDMKILTDLDSRTNFQRVKCVINRQVELYAGRSSRAEG